MNLKDTVKTNGKPTPKEMEEILTETGLKEPVSKTTLKTEQVDKTKKINVILTVSDHIMYKLHCQINNVDMQVKAEELILEWLKKQPKLGI